MMLATNDGQLCRVHTCFEAEWLGGCSWVKGDAGGCHKRWVNDHHDVAVIGQHTKALR